MSRTYLFWDIDGTLITTGGAGPRAWERAAAELLLEFFELSRFFGAGGVFSVEGIDRAAIAKRARSLATEHAGGELAGEQMVVIGDTPHDIACGKAIGARTVGVATGRVYSLEDLERAKPWRAFAGLPEPPRLGMALGLD
jgi:phosphoglycolate phosphatase